MNLTLKSDSKELINTARSTNTEWRMSGSKRRVWFQSDGICQQLWV